MVSSLGNPSETPPKPPPESMEMRAVGNAPESSHLTEKVDNKEDELENIVTTTAPQSTSQPKAIEGPTDKNKPFISIYTSSGWKTAHEIALGLMVACTIVSIFTQTLISIETAKKLLKAFKKGETISDTAMRVNLFSLTSQPFVISIFTKFTAACVAHTPLRMELVTIQNTVRTSMVVVYFIKFIATYSGTIEWLIEDKEVVILCVQKVTAALTIGLDDMCLSMFLGTQFNYPPFVAPSCFVVIIVFSLSFFFINLNMSSLIGCLLLISTLQLPVNALVFVLRNMFPRYEITTTQLHYLMEKNGERKERLLKKIIGLDREYEARQGKCYLCCCGCCCGCCCAMSRLPNVATSQTSQIQNPTLPRGTMEHLEPMKNDLTNYQISQNRAAIEEYSSKREYEMFQKTLSENPNGCNFTRNWLNVAYEELFGAIQDDSEASTSSKKEKRPDEKEKVLVDTTSRGYVKLVQHEEYHPGFPEVLTIDRPKIKLLAEKFLQIVVFFAPPPFSSQFKNTLKDHLIVITNNTDESRIQSDLEKIAEQCVKESMDTAQKLGIPWNPEASTSIRNQINALINPENVIRKLVHQCVSTFVEEMLRSPTSVPHRLLPGLSVIQSELCAFTSKFLRLCVHNHKTFYTMYTSLILEFQGDAPSTHAVYRPDSPSSMPGPSSQPGTSSSS